MEITINNERKTITQQNLAELIASLLGEKTKGIAVAVNNTVIPRAVWADTGLHPNDSILIIKATQGG